MIIKFLGIIDLIAAVFLLLSSIFPKEWTMVIAFYLLVKGGIFLLTGDQISILDVASGMYFMLVSIGFSSPVITALVVLFLLQKGAFSLLTT